VDLDRARVHTSAYGERSSLSFLHTTVGSQLSVSTVVVPVTLGEVDTNVTLTVRPTVSQSPGQLTDANVKFKTERAMMNIMNTERYLA